MFVKNQKLDSLIDKIKNDNNTLKKLNYEQLTILIEYLTSYKNYLIKKKEDK